MSQPYPTERRPKRQSAGVDTDGGYFAMVPEDLLYADVSDGALRLWAVLARHADNTGFSYPSRSRLAKFLRCSVDTIDRRIGELSDSEWLVVAPRFEESGQRSNGYTMRLRGRTDAAGPPGKDAAPPGRKDAAQKESHLEPEPREPELAADAASAEQQQSKVDHVRTIREGVVPPDVRSQDTRRALTEASRAEQTRLL